MLKKYKKFILLILFLAAVINFAAVGLNAKAADIYNDVIKDRLEGAKEVGLPGADETEFRPLDKVALIIKAVLSVLALVFLVLIIYAGIKWMTAGGNTDSIESAKKIITSALIGIIIVFLAYAITAFVFTVLLRNRYW